MKEQNCAPTSYYMLLKTASTNIDELLSAIKKDLATASQKRESWSARQ